MFFFLGTYLVIGKGLGIVGILVVSVRVSYVTVGAAVVDVRHDVCVVLNGLGPGDERELVLDANGLDHAAAAVPQQEQVPSFAGRVAGRDAN